LLPFALELYRRQAFLPRLLQDCILHVQTGMEIMSKGQKKQILLTHHALLLMVTMMVVTGTTVVEALVPSTTIRTITNNPSTVFDQAQRRQHNPLVGSYSSLMVTITNIEDDTDLTLSLPAMSAEIKQQYSKNNHERRERNRRRKQIKIDRDTPNTNNPEKDQDNKRASATINSPHSSELFDSIPKLSDILEGRTSSNEQEIKIINTMPKKKIDTIAPTRVANDKVPVMGSTIKIVASNKNKRKMQPTAQALRPWRANYKSSKRIQGRLRKAFQESSSSHNGSHSRARRILDTLLNTPPEYCNAVNLVCALTYSAKAMGSHRVDHKETNLEFRKSLQDTFDILYDLLIIHRDEGLFSPRQLCNVVWAIAKHVDRDPGLLFSESGNQRTNGTSYKSMPGMNVFKDFDSPETRLEKTIDEIAGQLTSILFKENNDVSDIDAGSATTSNVIKSSFQQPKIKLGEICMACWAFGKLRPRESPHGWHGPSQMGAVKSPDAIVADWKTGQLGTKQTFGKSFENDGIDDSNDENVKISITDNLFDAIGYALCQNADGDKQNRLATDGPQSALLEECTWSELANVGWAFASHGRCKSIESETLLKSVAQEAANRLKDGTIANNKNYEDFLARDVTQLLWTLGTLQSDNFRLADDLVLLLESLTTNLRLGTKTHSRFAQGRPLRRWSCADLVQTAVAMAHARIDENLMLRAIYEEGNYRLMEGASSSRRLSSMTQLPSDRRMSNNKLPLGENRRSFHPWEASILLWAQARLFLTEEEGIEFDEFAEDAPLFFLKALRESRGSFSKAMIGPQEQANIVWSLVILEKYDSPEAIILINLVFAEAARSCKENKNMQLEHAHQLWQAYFMLKEDCPQAVKRVPQWFVSYLEEQWSLEKARLKLSSARHQSLSTTLHLMGVDHINEHDEDIDVAIILQPNAVWVHETDMDEDEGEMYELGVDEDEGEMYESGVNKEDHVSVAVEFDGPNHFTRVRTQEPGAPRSSPEPPRALGHSVLKYRLLKKQGWTVVRIPYYEFDKIPFWASMERQRYIQRKLKTHANIQFSEVDTSEYKALTHNRKSRFD